MKLEFADIKTKPIFKSMLFYFIAALTIYLFEKILPTGAHTPGLGLLALLILPFISGVLLFINTFKFYKGQKAFGWSAALHFVIIVTFIIFFKVI